MAKKKVVNAETDRDVQEFIAQIPNPQRRTDSESALAVIREVTGLEPKRNRK